MGLFQNAIRKWKDKKEEREDFERQERMMEKFEARKLSSDERELMRFEKEDRKKFVKKALEARRKQMNNEIWSGRIGNPIFAPNVITDQKELFKGNENLFSNKSDLFNQPDLFFRRENEKEKERKI